MSPFIFILTILFFCVVSDGKKRYRSDYKYLSEIDAWLKFQKIPIDWNEARLRCRLEGGIIASPTTVALKKAMIDLLEENQVEYAYTGIHSFFSDGDYYSTEGIPLQQIPYNLSVNQMEYNRDKKCIVIYKDGTLNVFTCTELMHYICYKKFKKHDILTSCGTIDPDYYLDSRTGNCYKFHKTPRTWSRAFMTCSSEGGYLAIINSETEAQVIRDIYSRNPDDSIVGITLLMRRDVAFIGFNDLFEHGDWLTVQGETLKEAGYDSFTSGEPNNTTYGEFCGSVTRDGLLNDLWCDSPFPFICEKTPDSLNYGDEKF